MDVFQILRTEYKTDPKIFQKCGFCFKKIHFIEP